MKKIQVLGPGCPKCRTLVENARAAAELGWPFIAVADGEKARILKDEGAQAVIANYADVDAFFALIDKLTSL